MLLGAICGSALLIGTGYAIPHFVFGSRVDATVTGSVQAAVVPEVTTAAFVTPSDVRMPPVPENLISLTVPEVKFAPDATPPVPKASAGFKAALEVFEKGDHVRAYELARALDDSAERLAIQWLAIHDGNGDIDYRSVIQFGADAPDFTTSSVFRTRLEQALLRAELAGPEIIRHLGGAMPNTVSAQIALAKAYAGDGQKERAARIARTIWVENFLSRDEERRVEKALGDLLTAEDHWDRAVMLMMHDRATAAERLMSKMTPAQKSLAVARNATSRKRKDAKKLLDDVDPTMREHPLYIFSRVQRARQFGLWEDAVTWLGKAKGALPEAAEWWYERRIVVRALMDQGKYDLAYDAADGYRDGPEGRMVEAHFHAGWIALSYLDDAPAAVRHFEAMRRYATLPDSVTQANYWLGRARLAAGDEAGANEALAEAAGYGTVYYGLMAKDALGEGARVRDVREDARSRDAFEARDIVKAMRLFAANGQTPRALTLLRGFAPKLEDGGELFHAARLADELGAHDLAISIAETAERKGFPLDALSFPADLVPTEQVAEVEQAAIYAVVRQESRFRTDAVSSAGARGLMQLMPATARETAKKVGVDYSKGRLTSDPAYNALLGSTYLADQLSTFDGSLVLAAAAYNAGPGNARKWIRQYGDPRSDEVDPVDWVERIPYQETRKYVQRVVGNYLVYKARFGDEGLRISEVLRRIPS